MTRDISIILPAKNEAESLQQLLPTLREHFPEDEILVVNDGSTDATVAICEQQGVSVVSHVYSMGNGAAIKTGARNASKSILVFMDADGQHTPADITRLLDKIDEGYDMVVGARHLDSHASLTRRIGNTIYNKLASWMTGYPIEDLTSGFRAARDPALQRNSSTCCPTSFPTRRPAPWPSSARACRSVMCRSRQ